MAIQEIMMNAPTVASAGYAIVGTIGVVSQGAAGAAVTPAWGTGESRTAGNLLICFWSTAGATGTGTIPSGWSQPTTAGGTSCICGIYYKIAAGGDAAPTLSAVVSGVRAAQLAEFSGNAASGPLDRSATAASTTSPVTATAGVADLAASELLLLTSADFRSAARTPNDTLTSNHGTITQAGNNNGVSSVNHYSFGYCLATTSNSGGNTAVMTASVTTSITGLSVGGYSFKLL